MATISNIKLPNNASYNIRDDYSIWGGRNYILNSDKALLSGISNQNNSNTVTAKITTLIPAGTEIIISCQIDTIDLTWGSSGNKRAGIEIAVPGTQYIGAWIGSTISDSQNIVKVVTGTWSGRISKIFTTKYDIPKDQKVGLYVQWMGSGSCKVSKPQLEIGNKITDWNLAPEDIIRFIGNETLELYNK